MRNSPQKQDHPFGFLNHRVVIAAVILVVVAGIVMAGTVVASVLATGLLADRE